jgi:hypothetical protein
MLELQSVRVRRDRSLTRAKFTTLGLECFPVDSLALAQVGTALLTEPDEARGVSKDQVLGVDSEGEDNGHGLPAARDQKGLAGLGPINDVGCVGLEVTNSYRCHTVIVVANVTTWDDVRTATPTINHGKRRHSAALGELRPPYLNGAQRSVNHKVQGSNPWSGANLRIQIGRPRSVQASAHYGTA